MARKIRRAAMVSLVLGLSLSGTAGAQALDLDSIFGVEDVDRVVSDDLPAITGDVEGGLGALLGDAGLVGGILGGTDDLLGGVLGSLGLAAEPDLSIQPVPPMQHTLVEPKIGGGLLGGLFGIGSLTESLAGRT